MKSLARSFEPPFFPTNLRKIQTIGALVVSPAIVVLPQATIDEARSLLVEHRVPALAVVSENEKLLGLVTRTDVLRAESGATSVADVMSLFVFAVSANSAIEKAAALIAFEGVGQVVVTKNCGALLGIVSAVDIARHYAITAGYLRA
jgi:CBS domain-containing protein